MSSTFEEEALLADCGVRKERQLGEFHQRVCDRERESGWREMLLGPKAAPLHHSVCRYPGREISAEMYLDSRGCVPELAFVCVCLPSGGLFAEINAISDMPQSPAVCVCVCVWLWDNPEESHTLVSLWNLL